MPFNSHARRPAPIDVSVVIPVYNHAKYLEATVESALSQTAHPREILCIDDGSSDESFGIAESLARKHPSVRAWTRPNQGANRTINEGIRVAVGRYVAILNSDDLFEPERLERCVGLLEADEGASLVCTDLSFVDGSGLPIDVQWHDDAVAYHRRTGDFAASLVHANFLMTTSNYVARRTLFEEVGYFADLRYAHDLDFALRLLADDRRIAIVDAKLARYRIHETNTISESRSAIRTDLAIVVANYLRRRCLRPHAGDEVGHVRRVLAATNVHELEAAVTYLLARGRGPDDETGLHALEGDLARVRRDFSR